MSRRRPARTADAGVTTDELLAAMYGERMHVERLPMPGCQDRCCSPGQVTEDQVEAALWRAIFIALGSEIVVIVAVLALLLTAWRYVGGAW